MSGRVHERETPTNAASGSDASYVRALYADGRTLAIGITAASATASATALEARDPWLAAVAGTLLALGYARLISIRIFKRVEADLGPVGFAAWGRLYVGAGALYLGVLGLFCLRAFAFSDDSFVRIASLSITLAYLIGTPGRNFASPRLVDVQIAAAGVPMVVGVAVAGGWYWSVATFVLVPLLISLKTISTRLQGIFETAVSRTAEATRLASELDAALNNMPQGLAMFDASGRATVTNGGFDRLVAPLVPGGTGTPTVDAVFALWGTEPGDGSGGAQAVATTPDGRAIALRYQHRAEGGVVALFEDVTQRARDEAEILRLAAYDGLTGLLNRRSFRERAAAAEGFCSLLFIDLDRFKTVNDTLGHVAGDGIVVQAAARLRALGGPSALIARFGGDEFVLLRPGIGDRAGAEALAEAVIRGLSRPYDVEGTRATIGASVGVVLARDGLADIDAALRSADLALYSAKAAGRGTWRVFESAMQREAEARRRTEEDLRVAIARGELDVAYQPVWDARAGRYVSCEALARWHHPTRGPVSPAEFIPIAEEAGLMPEIGTWILRRACADCAGWPEGVGVAVNVSPVQFRDPDLPGVISDALAAAGLAPGRLEVEVTESVLLHEAEKTTATLRAIRALGVGLALDDFGTGYSALSYLRALPFSKIKVDRSFLTGIEADARALALLRSIRAMARDLGMAIVVEGVETEAQMALVSETAGVDLIQGFYIAKPMPLGPVADLLSQNNSRAGSKARTQRQLEEGRESMRSCA